MIVDALTRTITFHQSWLGDNLLCPERSRLNLAFPEKNIGSDATALGTGMHGYAEVRMLGGDREEAMAAGFAALDHELSLPHNNNGMSDSECVSFLPTMCAAWELKILPSVKPGGAVEHKFKVFLGDWNGWKIYLAGTMDYVDPTGKIWDWKTASQEYKRWEKERWAIQPTAYAIGAINDGLAKSYPINWAYGVVTKSPKKDPKVQIVEFQRNEGHARWLWHQITTLLDNAEHAIYTVTDHGWGATTPWTLNDQHVLCSEKWCGHWSECKGKFV